MLHPPGEGREWAEIVPVDDDHPLPHASETYEAACGCHCRPRVMLEGDQGEPFACPLIVHRSYDAREVLCQAEAILEETSRELRRARRSA